MEKKSKKALIKEALDKNGVTHEELKKLMGENNRVEQIGSYPECEKLDKHSDYINGVLEFIEFVGEKGISLVSKHNPSRAIYHDCDLDVHKAEDLLYEMFGIDRKKLEKERDDMLKAYQK